MNQSINWLPFKNNYSNSILNSSNAIYMLKTGTPEFENLKGQWFVDNSTEVQFGKDAMVVCKDWKYIFYDDASTEKLREDWVHQTSEVWKNFADVVGNLWDSEFFRDKNVLDYWSWKWHLWLISSLHWAKNIVYCDTNQTALDEAKKITEHNQIADKSSFKLPDELKESWEKFDAVIMNWYQNMDDEICWETGSDFQAEHIEYILKNHLNPDWVIIVKEAPRVEKAAVDFDSITEVADSVKIHVAQCLDPNQKESKELYPVSYHAITHKKEKAIEVITKKIKEQLDALNNVLVNNPKSLVAV